MATFECDIDPGMLFATSAFTKMAHEQGKSTKEVREAVRKSTTLFIHYIIDYATQQRQGNDDKREVAVRPADVIRATEALGFSNLARRIRSK
jgi:hypothetical protein